MLTINGIPNRWIALLTPTAAQIVGMPKLPRIEPMLVIEITSANWSGDSDPIEKLLFWRCSSRKLIVAHPFAMPNDSVNKLPTEICVPFGFKIKNHYKQNYIQPNTNSKLSSETAEVQEMFGWNLTFLLIIPRAKQLNSRSIVSIHSSILGPFNLNACGFKVWIRMVHSVRHLWRLFRKTDFNMLWFLHKYLYALGYQRYLNQKMVVVHSKTARISWESNKIQKLLP